MSDHPDGDLREIGRRPGGEVTQIRLADAVETYLERKSVGDHGERGSGTYASNAASILGRWTAWLERERDVTDLGSIDADLCLSYANELADRCEEGSYTPSTARTYFAVVRAFCSWCVAGGLLETNPARAIDVESVLPERSEGVPSGTDDERWLELESFVRERAESGVDGEGGAGGRLVRLREYALVAVLAHTDVRSGELFHVPEDDRRSGATWEDVDFYTATLRVLGTSQRLENVTLPAPARTPLRRYRIALDPPSTDWPLFPTRHAPSITRRVRVVLSDRGLSERDVDRALDASTARELSRTRVIPPPTITTEGARSILKRLCSEAGVTVDGKYLTPRGARRAGTSTERSPARVSPAAISDDVREDAIVRRDDGSDGNPDSES